MRTPPRRASDLERRVAALEKRLAHYDSERSIMRTLHRYCHAIDYGPPEAWADCFTEDGAIEVQRRNGRGRRAYGRAALTAFISTHTRAPATRHKHLALVPSITVTGDKASVVSYLVRVDEHDRGYPTVCWFGRYHDQMVRCPDGEWRIKKRHVEMEAGPMAWALRGQKGGVVRPAP